jgi:hypothetical protein
MAQAAEVLEFPAGGIADFYMEDHEIEALEREEAAQEYGSAGIATFEPIATRMASYGRYGDDTVAHVETGELIVPKALIDDNPKLRDSIFSHLRELGVEDPERYVVGSGANSINPDTGMPEFFLKKLFKKAKKGVSKVVKGVSKALKGVTQVIKKAAPVIIPFALNAAFPGLGAIYSGALGSGIGTLIQGGSLKDAFKNALIGGAIGGATAAIGGGLQAAKAGTGTFGQGAMKGLQDAAKFSNLQTAGKQLVSGQFGQAGYEKVLADQALTLPAPSDTLASATEGVTSPGDTVASATDVAASPADVAANDPFGAKRLRVAQEGTPTEFIQSPDATYTYSAEKLATTPAEFMPTTTAPAADSFTIAQQEALQKAAQPPGFLDSAKSLYQDPSLANLKELTFGAEPMTAAEVLTKAGYNPATVSAESALGKAAAKAAEESASGLVRSFGIPATVGTGAAAYGLSKAMDDNEDEEDEEERRRREEMERLAGPNPIFEARPGDFTLSGFTPQYATGDVFVPTTFTQGLGQYSPPTTFAADGGEIFPRRVGGIMPDEGTPGKDSVKAMLMPGEFVMTTNAVKGLGDGDNNKGINRMYDMMRGLEAKGKAMA